MALSDAHSEFRREMLRSHLYDQQLNDNPPAQIAQSFLLREAIYLNSYVAMERLLEKTFIAFSIGEATLSGVHPNRYLQPTSEQHAYEMVKSSLPFLDWTSPDTVVSRCEIYFQNGDPLKTKVAARMDFLRHAKRIRNHLAHRSRESASEFTKAINFFLPTPPLAPISQPGEFLGLVPSSGPCRNIRILKFFLNGLSDFGDAIVE